MDSIEKYKEILSNNYEYDYETIDCNVQFTYESPDTHRLRKLRRKYKLDEIAGYESEFKRMSNLMVWVADALKYDGDAVINIKRFNALHILKQTKNKAISSNCWMYATVLNEVFLSMGFKSRRIRCMSADMEDTECHCVTIAYSTEYKKWILFDAANKAFFVNTKAQPMSLAELRDSLYNNEKFILPKANKSDFEKIKNYWYKNIIRFQCYSHSAFNIESKKDNKTVYNLNPSSIVIHDDISYENGIKITYKNTTNPNLFWGI